MQTKVRPLGQHVLIKQVGASKMTAGGLHIPETAHSAKAQENKGVVVAAGPGRTTNHGVLVPVSVAIGDVVWWSRHQGTEFDHGGEKLWLVREDDINGFERPEVTASDFEVQAMGAAQ